MTAKRQPTLSLAECHRKRVVVVCAELLLALKHLLRRDVNIARAHPEFWTLQTAVSRLPASLVRRCIVVINVLSLNTNCQTRNWVIRSPGQWVIFHVRVTESSFWPGVRPEIFRFSKKCPKCKTYIWNAEMTKVIARCLLLDWNHWMLVHAMNFYLYVWLLKIRTPLHISRYLECIIEQSHRVNWVAGFPGHWVTKCDPVPCLLYCNTVNQSISFDHLTAWVKTVNHTTKIHAGQQELTRTCSVTNFGLSNHFWHNGTCFIRIFEFLTKERRIDS